MATNPHNPIYPSQAENDEVLEFMNEKGPISRRRFLIKLSLFVGSVSAASWLGIRHRHQIDSFWHRLAERVPFPSPAKPPVASTPQSPIPDNAGVRQYRNYLSKPELPFLNANEILLPHFKYRSGVCSGVPPRYLWRNMRNTARVANEIRRRLGVPLRTVVSAYRSPEYNSKCPGASKYSQHLQNRALDLIFDCPSQCAFDMVVKLRDEGFFKGGIGLYSNFIHIDTRGRNATWGV